MPAAPHPVLRNVILAAIGAVATWCLWPAESAWWRRLAGMALGGALGFHAGLALGHTTRRSRIAAISTWLECLAFPLAMGAFYHLPSARGWLLLLASWVWRFLVLNLWK